MHLDELTAGTLLGGSVLVGLVAALWGRLKALAFRAFSMLVVVVEFHGSTATYPVIAWVQRNGRRMPGGTRWYFGLNRYLRPKERYQTVLFENFSSHSALYLFGWRPLWAGFHAQSGQLNGTDHDAGRVRLYFFRGTFDPDAIGFAAVEADAARGAVAASDYHRHQVITLTGEGGRRGHDGATLAMSGGGYANKSAPPADVAESQDHLRVVGYTHDDLGQPLTDTPFLGLFYPPEVVAAVDEVGRWLKSEKWYRSKGLPWRRGWLLTGVPGTGKSRLVRAVAQKYDLPVHVYDLATMDNRELDAYWQKTLANAPAMAVFEDLDGVFHGRDNVLGDRSGLTFDKLLQCLSGVAAGDGVFVVVTTNRPELLDPAIGRPDDAGESGRPGRIDRVIALGPPTPEAVRQILAAILGDLAAPGEVDKMAHDLGGRSAAQVTEQAARVALARYWAAPASELPTPALSHGPP